MVILDAGSIPNTFTAMKGTKRMKEDGLLSMREEMIEEKKIRLIRVERPLHRVP